MKHSCLLGLFISYKETDIETDIKSFITLVPGSWSCNRKSLNRCRAFSFFGAGVSAVVIGGGGGGGCGVVVVVVVVDVVVGVVPV
jgi:hypothetical protein